MFKCVKNRAMTGMFRGHLFLFFSVLFLFNAIPLAAAGLYDDTNGNVGIGTTNPSQKLHVEGQCVTGDTVLSIFAQEVQGSRLKVQGVKIKDVKPGMMVYSLNEELSLIEPHRIIALLDMGVKPVFKLTTKDGKSIKTTGNHPYLVAKQGEKDREEVAARRIRSLESQYGLSGQSLRSDRNVSEGRTIWLDNKAANAAVQGSRFKVQGDGYAYAESVTPVGGINPLGFHSGVAEQGSTFPSVIASPEGAKQSLTNADWTKVIYLLPGDFIAVSSLEPRTYNLERYVLWAEIESIEYIGKEQVYDITVEGTQNFFGNGILAHNTYLNGNVGIGTTGPLGKLIVKGAGTTTGIGFQTQNSSGTALVTMLDNGNVGIGATDPQYSLEVVRTNNYALSGTAYRVASFQAADGIGDDNPGLILGYDTADDAGVIAASAFAGGAPGGVSLAFWTWSGVFWGERMRISKTGNVGIGTTGPGHKLDVNGNIGASAGSYINFGSTDGTSGYGFYDNGGTMQVKNSGGSWANIPTTAPPFSNVQVFESSGTFTVPAGVTKLWVEVYGGGGGGGGSGYGNRGGGGGGAGGVAMGFLSVSPSQEISVTVGSGGGGASGDENTGGTGATSVFSSLSATGGSGGRGAGYKDGGAGGSGIGGTINSKGGGGGYGALPSTGIGGGAGGSNMRGGGANGVGDASNGANGSVFGGGGGGGYTLGGNGGAGGVIVWW